MPDISHWQGHHTAEDMIAAGGVANAIMLKATQGVTFVDDEFVSNANAANEADLPWGAYHFVDPGHGVDQADHFRTVARSLEGCKFLCIDWESGSREVALAIATRLRNTTGLPIGDYIGSHARANGGQLPGMSFHMVPQYGPAELDPQYATDPLSAWQYTNGETNGTDMPSGVPGIGKCDMSVLYRPGDFGL
jgi:lysozyme